MLHCWMCLSLHLWIDSEYVFRQLRIGNASGGPFGVGIVLIWEVFFGGLLWLAMFTYLFFYCSIEAFAKDLSNRIGALVA